MAAFATLLIGPCARQSSRKSACSLGHRPGLISWRARCASGGRYLERIKADRHAAKLGVFVLELIRKTTAFAILLTGPCVRSRAARSSAGSLVHRSQVWSDLGSGGAALRTVAYFSSGIWDLQQSQELRQKDTALDEIPACQMLSASQALPRPTG